MDKEETIRGGLCMLPPGTRVKMLKGYKGVEGEITEQTHSEFELYLIDLVNGIRIVAGPSAFAVIPKNQN